MAKEPLSPTVEEVAAQKAPLNNASPLGDAPTPDMPYTSTTTAYADPGHVNPALEPAPIWEPAERPAPVPVINDPGVLGGNPSLADLNASNRQATAAALGVDAPDEDQTSGITAESHLAEIKRVATERLKKLREVQSTAATDARTGVAPQPKAASKLGSASK
jgi:hypothetical protein